MNRNGKIHQIAPEIRDQLNRRLNDGETGVALAEWLNSLPQVQQLIASQFDGFPVTPQNVSDWKQGPYRDWQICQKARHILQSANPDDPELKQLLSGSLADNLAQWLTLRFAAAAHSLASLDEQDPKAELRLLGQFSADVIRLLRSQLSAGRLKVEQQRLALDKSRDAAELETLFWDWTKRPDIVEKLFPHRDTEKIRRQVDRMLSRRLLGIKDPGEFPDETADPACLI